MIKMLKVPEGGFLLAQLVVLTNAQLNPNSSSSKLRVPVPTFSYAGNQVRCAATRTLGCPQGRQLAHIHCHLCLRTTLTDIHLCCRC